MSFYSAILANDEIDRGTVNRGASLVAQMVKGLPAGWET